MVDYRQAARDAARQYGVPEDLFLRVIQQESGFRPDVTSSAGAYGLAQLMPGTAAELGVDPRDPLQNLAGGARYLRQQLDAFGDPALALAAYNAGPGRVRQYGGIPPFEETQNYVQRILGGAAPLQATMSTRGNAMNGMQQQPRGILESLGIQRRDPEAEGETALPFYQRDRFADVMGGLAVGLNELRAQPSEGVRQAVAQSRGRREQAQQRNATADWIASQGRTDLAEGIRNGSITAAQALQMMQPKGADPTSNMQDYQFLLAQGMTPQEAQAAVFGGRGTTVNVGDQETTFARTTGTQLAQEASEIVQQGMQAQRAMGQLETLEAALANAPQGVAGNIGSFASGLGISVSPNMSDLQVAEAIISQLVPQQRPPGSGVMSDADLELFKRSLPRLANTREGNQKILQTMRAISEYDMQRAQIANRMRFGEITPQEAYQMYAELPNPVAEFVRGGGGTEADAADELERLLGQ